MPQLDHSSFLNQIIWLVVFLLVLYFIIVLLVLPTIHKVIAVRRLMLTSIIQKGYIFSHRIIKRSKFNDMFNYMLTYFSGIMLLNVFCFKKLVKISSQAYNKTVLLLV